MATAAGTSPGVGVLDPWDVRALRSVEMRAPAREGGQGARAAKARVCDGAGVAGAFDRLVRVGWGMGEGGASAP